MKNLDLGAEPKFSKDCVDLVGQDLSRSAACGQALQHTPTAKGYQKTTTENVQIKYKDQSAPSVRRACNL
jgi:hypothetical protein